MKLSAPRFDVALYTNNHDSMLSFWRTEIGAVFDKQVSMGAGGGIQHRHLLRNCVLKVNCFDGALPADPPSGYRDVFVATEGVTAPRSMSDPDGNMVTLVPVGWRGITEIAVLMDVNAPSAHHVFYTDVLGFEFKDGVYRLGESGVILSQAATVVQDSPMKGLGYRYLTLPVADVYAAHAEALAAGVQEGAAVREVGDIIRYSQLRDPDGNWLELSQR